MKTKETYIFTNKRKCALLIVIMILINMFSPYGVLVNKVQAAEPAEGEPYYEISMLRPNSDEGVIENLRNIAYEEGDTDAAKAEDSATYFYYFDYINGNVDSIDEIDQKAVVMQLKIKGSSTVNAGSINIQYDSSKIQPAYDYITRKTADLELASTYDEFAQTGWAMTIEETLNLTDSQITLIGLVSDNGYIKDGEIVATFVFKLADGLTIDDLTTDCFTTVPTGSVNTGLRIPYFVEGIQYHVDGNDYLKFDGFSGGAAKVDKIEIKTEPTKNKYYHTEDLDFAGGIITVIYDDGVTTEDINIQEKIKDGSIQLSSTTADEGTQKVTLTYKEKTVEWDYYTLDSISVKNELTKMEYEHDDEVEFAGGTLEAVYTHGTGENKLTQEVELNITDELASKNLTVNDVYSIKADVDNTTLTFNYHGKTITMELDVTDPVDWISISKQPNTVVFDDGELIDLSGGEITQHTRSGKVVGQAIPMTHPSVSKSIETADINLIPEKDRWDVIGDDGLPTNLKAGKQVVTLTYEGKTVDLEITVNDVIKDVTITTQPTAKNKYGITKDQLDFHGLVATVTTNGGGSFTVEADSLNIDTSTYVSNTLATQNFKASYGGVTARNEVEIKLTNYITGITVNFPETTFNYGTTLDEAIKNATYTEIYADTSENATKNITPDMVTGYNGTPAASLFDENNTYEENLKIVLSTSNNEFDVLPATADQKITIKDVIDETNAISIKFKPTVMTYEYGEEFKTTGGVITIHYKSGTTKDLSMGNANVTITELDGITPVDMEPEANNFSNAQMTKSLKVNYNEGGKVYSTTLETLTILDILTGIKDLEGQKTQYKHADEFQTVGTFTATYISGKEDSINLSEATLKETNTGSEVNLEPEASQYSNRTVTKNVTVSYTLRDVTKTLAYDITIKDYVTGIQVIPNEVERAIYDALNTVITDNDIKYTVTYAAEGVSSPETLEASMVTGFNISEKEQTLTVTYEDNDTNSATYGETFENTLKVTLSDKVDEITINLPTVNKINDKDEAALEAALATGNIVIKYKNGETSEPIPLTKEMIKEEINLTATEEEYDANGQKVEKTFTIEYEEEGVSATPASYTLTIVNDIKSISIYDDSAKDEYNMNEEFTLDGAEILVQRAVGTDEVLVINDNLSDTLTDGKIVVDSSSFNKAEEGSYKIVVKYQENGIAKETSYQAKVKDTIISVTKGNNPTKTEYKYGVTNLDLTGGTIVVVKGSGTEEIPMQDATVTKFDKEQIGTQTVEIEYEGQKIEFDIVIKDYVTGIEVTPNTATGTVKDTLQSILTNNNITYTVTYAKAGEKPAQNVTVDMVSGYNSETTNAQNLKVTYQDQDTESATKGEEFTKNLTITLSNPIDEIIINLPTVNKINDKDETAFEAALATGNVVIKYKDGTTQEEPIPLTKEMIKEEINLTATEEEYKANGQKVEKTFTIEYEKEGVSATPASYTLTIVNDIKSISLEGEPKNIYNVNEEFETPDGNILVTRAVGSNLISIKDNLSDALSDGKIVVDSSSFNKEEEGKYTIVVKYQENGIAKETSYKVEVKDTITSVTKGNNPTKTEYKYGVTDLDLTGGTIVVVKGSGTEEVSMEDATVTRFDKEQIGTQTVEIEYEGQKIEFDIVIKDYVTGIEVTPNTVTGTVKDTLQSILTNNNVTYTVTYAKAGEKPAQNVTVDMISGYNSETTNAQNLKVTYQDQDTESATKGEEFTKSLTITLSNPIKEIVIEKMPSKITYKHGEELVVSDGKIRVNYESGDYKVVPMTKDMVTQADGKAVNMSPEGTEYTNDEVTKTLTIKYTEGNKTVTQNYDITIKDYTTGIIVKGPQKVKYEVGESLDLTGATVQSIMASGNAKTPVALTNSMITNTFNPNLEGVQTLNVSYEGFTDSFIVTVEDSIKSISIGNSPKTLYKYGESLDVTGGTIIVIKSSGNKETITLTASMVTGYNPNKLGKQTLTVTYKEKTVSFEVNVEDYVKDIEITKPTKDVYKIGESIDLTGGTVSKVMASGTATSPVAMQDSKVTIKGFDTTSEGAKLIQVTYEGFTKTFSITVIDEIKEAKINTLPNKTEYLYGEKLDLTGGKIEITKESGKTTIIDMTSDMVTGYNPKKLGNQTLTVTYEGEKIGEFIVNVEDKVVGLKITAPSKTDYEYGESLDLNGGKVSVVMASGAIEESTEMTASMVSGFDSKKTGTQTIQVEYKGLKGTFKVTVTDKVKGITLETEPNKVEYEYGEELDLTGGTIKVIKSSGETILPITKNMVTGYNPNKSGTQIITVTYEGYTAKFIVFVNEEIKEDPEQPVNPEQPENPEKPEGPENPTQPEKPVEPADPNTPNKPADTDDGNNNGNNNNNNNNNNNSNNNSSNNSNNAVNEENKNTPNSDSNNSATNQKPEQDLEDNSNNITESNNQNNSQGQDDQSQIVETKPTETLGVKDEKNEAISQEKIIAGIVGISGLFILLILILFKRNVKIYVEEEGKFQLGGFDKLTNKNRKIDVNRCLDGDTYNNRVKIRLSKAISEKLDQKEIEIKHRSEIIKYKIEYNEKPIEIILE